MAAAEASHVASRAVDDLYRQHRAEVYRYAYAVLGSHADAEDVTQTTFLNAYRALEQGVRPRKPANWLLTIASNAIKQRFRREQARPREVELDERIASSESDDEGPSVGELLTALSKIPPQQRQAIVLREFEGRSYGEIAEILGTTTSALETLLFRARRSLARELEQALTCTEAQLAVSQAVDGRLGRKERRRLKDHLAECPDCAHFARAQPRHRHALRGLMLVPIPVSLTLFKGLEGAGTATAATIPVGAGGGATPTVASTGVTSGLGSAGTAGGSAIIGGATLKAAAVIAAVAITGGIAVTGAVEFGKIGNETTTAASSAAVRLAGGLHRPGAARKRVVARSRVAAIDALDKTARSTSTNGHREKAIEGAGPVADSGDVSAQHDADSPPAQPEPQPSDPQGSEPQGSEPSGGTPQPPESQPNQPQGSPQVPTQSTVVTTAPNPKKQPKKARQSNQVPKRKPAKPLNAQQPPKPQQGPKQNEPPGQSKTETSPAGNSAGSSKPSNEKGGGSKP